MIRRTFVGALLAIGLMLGTAYATPIDFTSSLWSAANNQTSYSVNYGGILVTVTSVSANGLRFNSGGDIHASCAAVTGLACAGDGLGITDDEVTVGDSTIEGNEQLRVTFSSPVTLNSFGFLDLYASGGDDVARELAMWTYGGGASGSLLAPIGNVNNTDPGWAVTGVLGAGPYTSVTFYATYPPAPRNTDFALAKIDFTAAVPDGGATLILLGCALVGLGALRRRFSA